ncbi:MAG: hypothetical protein RLZZ292_633 [Bacteroidota bacterium]|jgi:hypothetical protein
MQELFKKLPTYSPPNAAWEGIVQQLVVEEEQENKLQDALKKLPLYTAPSMIWSSIEGALEDSEEEKKAFEQEITQLPTYSPPISLWDSIEQELDSTPMKASVLKPVFGLKAWQKYAIAALFMGCLLTFGVVFYQNATSVGNEKITIAYSEEKYDPTPIKEDWDDDEAAFAKVEEICQQQAFLCEQPEVKTLKSELDELNEAKQSLKTALGQYGTDETVVAELVAVEKERTAVLKKIMEKI